MQYTELGRTGLNVSVAGIGCGGHSRLGMSQGKDEAHAATIVEAALELGINFVDTARAYGTEGAVGRAIKGKRDKVIVSTKTLVGRGNDLLSGDEIVVSLEKSLARLQTDYVDVFNLHGVRAEQYAHSVKEILPALIRQQEKGKIRFLGITEQFVGDPAHEMLQLALPDDYFDVVMVGFSMLNPNARKTVFPVTIKNNVATQIMFAVRRALSQPEALLELIEKMIDDGTIEASMLYLNSNAGSGPLAFVQDHPGVVSLVQAAYRFCRHEPGATVTLTGTGDVAHLAENVSSILAEPLPEEISARLESIFGNVNSVSGN